MPLTSPRDPLGLLGQTLDGRYLLRDVLGAGDSGVVYYGEHVALRRPCAIKVLQPLLQRDPARLRRVLESSRRVAQLGCDRLVVADDILAGNTHTAFVTPLLHGEDLAARLRRGPLPWGQVRDFALQLGAALRELHAHDLAFGGLKPSNLFLLADGDDLDVRLLDVGISRHDPQTASAAYISPEQVQSNLIDARSDLYSFAVVLHELLTGRPLFAGTPTQVAQMHRFKPPRGPSSDGASLPPAVDALLLAALAKVPDARPSLAELLAAIEHAEVVATPSHVAHDPPTMAVPTPPADDAPTGNLSVQPHTRRVPAPSFRAGPPVDEDGTTQFFSVRPPATLSLSGELDDPDRLTRPASRPPEERTQTTPIFTPRAQPARASVPRAPQSADAADPPPPPAEHAADPGERTVLSPALRSPQGPAASTTNLAAPPPPRNPSPARSEYTVPSPANLAAQSPPHNPPPARSEHTVPAASPQPLLRAPPPAEHTVPSPASVAPRPSHDPALTRTGRTVPSPASAQPQQSTPAPERTLALAAPRTEIIAVAPSQSRDGPQTAIIPGFGGSMLHEPGATSPSPGPSTDLVVAPPRRSSRLWARLRALLPARSSEKPGFLARFRRAPPNNRLPVRRAPAWLDGFLRGLANLPRRVGALWRLAARPFAGASALRSRFSTPLIALRSSFGKLWRMITRYTGGGAS